MASGAEIAGAVIAFPLFVVPGLVVFLIRVFDVIGVGRVIAGGEGDCRVMLGLDVLIVVGFLSSQMVRESTSFTAAPSGRIGLSVNRAHRQFVQSRSTASPNGMSNWFTEAADRSARHSGLPWSLPLPVGEAWQVMGVSRADPRGTSGLKIEPSMRWRSSPVFEDMSAGYAQALTVRRVIGPHHSGVS
ncbi:hypothetical protein [Streptomyces sp. NPDC014733]|uniref:hypothetical protein n=1 Tax=Streptomyces sp. NPDC014733 TaxID=3364885 RepID=UPI0036FA9EBC